MFKLFKLNDDKYMILKGSVEFEGDKKRVIKEMLTQGVDVEEVMHGMLALEKDDVADYGLNKSFIYSEKLKKQA